MISVITQKLINYATIRNLPILTYVPNQDETKIEIKVGSIPLIIIDALDDNVYLEAKIVEVYNIIRGSFTGLSSDGDGSNIRRTKNNIFIDSTTVPSLQEQWRFDVASLFPNSTGLISARIIGPLGYLQADEDRIYFNVGNFGWEEYIVNPEKEGRIVALDRGTGQLVWSRKYSEVSTQAQRMLAQKFPKEYNQAIVDNWTRDVINTPGGSFGPLTLYKDYILTGDGTSSFELYSNSYFNSLPQANGGPVLKENWGVDRNNRHLLRTTFMVLNKKTGELLAVNRFTDSGEGVRTDKLKPHKRTAQGYVKPLAAFRMCTAFEDRNNDYVITPDSNADPLASDTWLITDGGFVSPPGTTQEGRIATAIANGNLSHRYGRITKFKLNQHPNGLDVDEVWRVYGHPDRLFAGDKNPYTGQIFLTDIEAEEYNYQYDGIWGQGQLVDLERRSVVFGGSNGKMMPKEDIIAGWNAVGTIDPVTGAQGYPNRTFYEWTRQIKLCDTPAKLKKFQLDFAQTRKDRWAAMVAVSNGRIEKYLPNAVASVDLDTGDIKWVFKRQPFDTWQSLQFQLYSLGQANMPLHVQYQYVGEGSDSDVPMGPINVPEYNLYIVVSKDGTIQGLNPETGEVLWDTRVGLLTAQGTLNYGATIVGHYLYVASMNYNQYGAYYGTINHESYLDANNLPVLEPRDPEADGLLEIPLPTDKLVGNMGVNTLIPAKQMCIVKINILDGEIEAINTLNSVAEVEDTRYASFSTNISSVNDVVFIGGGYSSKAYAFNAVTLEPIWSYNTFSDIAAYADPDRHSVFMDSSIVAVGKYVYFGASESSFAGKTEGRYIYSFTTQ